MLFHLRIKKDYLNITYDVTDGYTQVSEDATVALNDNECERTQIITSENKSSQDIKLEYGGGVSWHLLWLILYSLVIKFRRLKLIKSDITPLGNYNTVDVIN